MIRGFRVAGGVEKFGVVDAITLVFTNSLTDA